MTTYAISIVILRVLGICLLIGGGLATPKLFFWHRALLSGQTGRTPLYVTGTETHRLMVVRDAVYSEQGFTPAFLSTAAALSIDLLLIVLATPVARLVSRGTEMPTQSTPND